MEKHAEAKSEGREAKFREFKAKSEGKRQQWNYLAVRKLLALLRWLTSKHHGDFYCLNCLFSFATEKNNLNCIKRYVKVKIFVTLCLLKTIKY